MPTAKLMAVLGACRRQGRWEVSDRTSALVIFGHCYIDFREAYADPELETMKMSVFCLFGNATFLMPEGAHVRPSVVNLLASTSFDVPASETESSLPTIVLESTTLFGRCRVQIAGEEIEQEDAADGVGEAVEMAAPEISGDGDQGQGGTPAAASPVPEVGEPSDARRDLEQVEATPVSTPPIPAEAAQDEKSQEPNPAPEMEQTEVAA